MFAHDEYYNVMPKVTAESCRIARFPAVILQGGSRCCNRI